MNKCTICKKKVPKNCNVLYATPKNLPICDECIKKISNGEISDEQLNKIVNKPYSLKNISWFEID